MYIETKPRMSEMYGPCTRCTVKHIIHGLSEESGHTRTQGTFLKNGVLILAMHVNRGTIQDFQKGGEGFGSPKANI